MSLINVLFLFLVCEKGTLVVSLQQEQQDQQHRNIYKP